MKHPTNGRVESGSRAPALVFCLPLLLWLPLVACAGDFEPGSHLVSLRLLAVTADQPIALPGEEVALEALAFDPQGRAVTWAWATCSDAQGSTAQACLEALDEGSRVEGLSLSQHHITVPSDLLDNVPEGARDAVYVGVVVALCPGTFVDDTTVGVPFACDDEQGRRLDLSEMPVGFKRVRVRERDRNQNPEVLGLTWAGREWPTDTVETATPCDEVSVASCPEAQRFEIAAHVSAAESGDDELGAPFHEQVIVQYYATHGRFEDEVRTGDAPLTRWAALDSAPGDVVTLFVVVRDDRGGTSFVTRELVVR